MYYTALKIAALTLVSTLSMASEPPSMDKVKTGILPSGHLYSLYHVSCQDEHTAAIARMDRGRRWCLQVQGDLSCYGGAEQASKMACSERALLASKSPGDTTAAIGLAGRHGVRGICYLDVLDLCVQDELNK